MQKNKWIFYILSGIILASCEDPIDVDLKPAESQLTIDAVITTDSTEQTVKLTQSIGYLVPGIYPEVTNASVYIIDTANLKIFNFVHKGNGIYAFKPNASVGDTFTVGKNYVLAVIRGADTFVSFSKLRPTTSIDSFVHTYLEEDFGRKAGNYVELWAKDLIGIGNTYWIRTFRNDTFLGKAFEINYAYDGAFSPGPDNDGIVFIPPIRYFSLNDFNNPYPSGTKVRTEILSISPEFLYFLAQVQIQLQNGGLFATPPANVITNITNFNPKNKAKANGFFLMSDISKAEIIIP